MIRLSEGSRVVLIYLFFTYVVFGIFFEFFGQIRNLPYNNVDFVWYGGVTVLCLFLLNLKFKRRIKDSNFRKLTKFKRSIFLRPTLHFAILTLMGLVFIYGWYSGLSGFRYSNIGISQSGTLLLVYALITSLLNFLLFFYIFFAPQYIHGKNISCYLLKYLLIVNLIFSINGNARALFSILGLVFVFRPHWLNVLVFREFNVVRSKHLKLISLIIVTPILLALAYVIGSSIKTGATIGESYNAYISIEFIQGLVGYFSGLVFSPSYVSLKYASSEYLLSTDFSVLNEYLLAPIRNGIFRINTICGNLFSIKRPDNATISRINYMLITKPEISEFRLREGTSPGLIASFFYCAPFPFNIAMAFCYLRLIRSYFDFVLDRTIFPLRNVGIMILLVFFFTPFTSSPIDLLLLVDNVAFSIFLMLFFRYFVLK